MPLPKYSMEDIVVFIDNRERGSDGNEDLLSKLGYRDTRRYPFLLRKAGMDVADILICVRVKKAHLLALRLGDGDDMAQSELERKLLAENARLRADLAKAVEYVLGGEKPDSPEGNDVSATQTSQPQLRRVVREERDNTNDDDDDNDDDDKIQDVANDSGNIVVPSYWLYDPVGEYVSYRLDVDEAALESGCVLVPLAAIERKKDTDLASSINGIKNQPDFMRFSDQKIRMQGFDWATGAQCGVLVEEYIKNCNNARIGRLPEDSFNSAVVHTAWRNKFLVNHTVNLDDTARHICKLARDFAENQFTNVVFPHLFCRTARGLAAGTIRRREEDKTGYEEDVRERVIARIRRTRELYDGVVPVEKLGKDHSDIISLRKRDLKDPRMCYLMQLQSYQGVKDKAQYIARVYPTMHDLVHAYDAAGTEKKRELMLADIETDTLTSGKNPKKRKLGPAISAYVYHTSMGRTVRIEKGKAVKETAAAKGDDSLADKAGEDGDA